MSKKTIVDVFEHSVKAYANNTFLMEKVGQTWVNTVFEYINDCLLAHILYI